LAQKAMHEFKRLGYLRIIITNQPDVAHGYMKQEEWNKIHNAFMKDMRPDYFLACTHREIDGCEFKKPSPLMLKFAVCKFNIDMSQSYMIGDTDNDTLAGRAAGCKTILLKKDYNRTIEADFRVNNLMGAVRLLRSL